MITLLAGFLAGLLHVFMGPDHLAAIAPLSVKNPKRSWIAGLRWGLGHTAGVLCVAALFLLLRELIPVELISDSSDRLVGLLLIGIGVWAFRKAWLIHSHTHVHEGTVHEHIHLHARDHEPAARHAHAHEHAAFGIGTLHGLAGSSHFLGILPALALPSRWLAGAYLAAFGVGTICAMILFSSVLGKVAARFSIANSRAYRGLMFGCSTVAIGIGCVWISGHAF
jgi:sulfite exporter TauE/SafE